MEKILISLFIALVLLIDVLTAGKAKSLDSVPMLEKAMYLNVEGYPCVRLLNLSGEIGCSNPERGKVVAPIIGLMGSDVNLGEPSALLIQLNEMQNFFTRLSNDPNFAQRISGVLIATSMEQNESQGYSPARKFPQAEFAPYHKPGYEWNLPGSGIMFNRYDFPIFLLPPGSTQVIQESAHRNVETNNAYTVDVAEFDLVMQTTKSRTHNTETCLKEQTCLPLGGYSVWASLPPINVSSSTPPKQIILVVASMDSASFFRDKSIGADSSLSGMISLLAAVDALSHIDNLNNFSKQLVFMVFTGESWGYLGSRRFLAELDVGGNSVNGLNITLIEQVLEIGSTGKSSTQDLNTFFAHSGGDSSTTKVMLNALKQACVSLGSESVQVKSPNISNPGIPPSSLMSFLRKNSTLPGIVLEDFDSVFTNTFYESHLDDQSNINISSITMAASLVARTLYILSSTDSQSNMLTLKTINANASLVKELVGCLLSCQPGLSCELVRKFIKPKNVCPNHYVGVFQGSPSSLPSFEILDDTPRFVWNFLADRTSLQKIGTHDCSQGCNETSKVCVGLEVEGKGKCVISTTRYVPAYSTRLNFNGQFWSVLPANSSDPMGIVDPVWTESFWSTIGLRAYTAQTVGYNRLIFIIGIIVTVSSYVAILVAKSFFMKALKRD